MVNGGLISLDFKKTYHRIVAHRQAKMMEIVLAAEVIRKEEMVKGNGNRHC